MTSNELINGGSSRFGFSLRRGGGEGAAGPIEMSIDAGLVAPHLIHVPHDQKLLLQRLERFEYAIESFFLQGGGDAQSEKQVEGSDGDVAVRSI